MDALAISSVSKTFNDRLVLDRAAFEVRRGEVHGLVGQNGCGKSTLIKIMAGYHSPDPGSVASVQGRPLQLGDAHAAHAAGLRFIHQDLGLVGDMSVVDNLALGQTYQGRLWLSDRGERRAAGRLLGSYDVDLDVTAPVRSLSPAQQTFVAVVRALRGGLPSGSVLVLDEPTAALPADEVTHLFGLLRGLRAHGVAVVMVSHRLNEILALADRVTALRDGKVVGTAEVSTLDRDSLAELVLGRSVEQLAGSVPPAGAPAALEIRHLRGGTVEDASLTVHRGEVVGVTGLVGGGYDQLLSLVFGAVPHRTGEVSLNGRSCANDPAESVRSGLAYAPADRKRLGAIAEWSLRENVTLPSVPSRTFGWLGERSERSEVGGWLRRLHVGAVPEQSFWTLSGGNQQRVVLAKWLRQQAPAVLIDEPSSGVDVGARQAIYTAIAAAAQSGTSFLLASSDAEELAAVCDRVLVFADGTVQAELHGSSLTVDNITSESIRSREEVPA